MADETIVTTLPVEIPAPKQDWSLSVLGKKMAWMISLWETANQSGIHVAPTATAIIEKISNRTAQAGITIHINQPVFENALPVIIFGFLLIGYDYAKIKTDSKWL